MFVEAVVFLAAIVGILLAISSMFLNALTRKADKEEIESVVDAVTDIALEEINKTSQLIVDELDEKYKALLFVYQLMDDKQKSINDGANVDLDTEQVMSAEEGQEQEDKKEEEHEEKISIDISIDDDIDVLPVASVTVEELIKEFEQGQYEEVESDYEVDEEPNEEIDKEIDEFENIGKIEKLIESEDINIFKELIGIEKIEEVEEIQEIEEVKPSVISAHPKFDAIKKLQAEGASVEDIARQLGIGQGEIRLIIGLSGR